jgi:hypothetical protein
MMPCLVAVSSFMLLRLLVLAAVGPVGVAGLHELVKYTSQSAWNAALPGGGPTWCVNFNYLTSDSRISTSGRTFQDTVNTNRLIIATEGSSIQSDIDSNPFGFSGDIDGTTYAALYVDRDSTTRVRLTFTNSNGIRAWSAFFKGVSSVEGLRANIVSTGSSAVITEDVPNGFFGFTIDEDLQSIVFTAKNLNGDPNTGTLFSVDNVCVSLLTAPTTPTPPTPTPPTPSPPDNDDERCDIDIPLIGWILCFLVGIFQFIF